MKANVTLVVSVLTFILVAYMAYSLFTVQKALSDAFTGFGEGLPQMPDTSQIDACVKSAGEDLDKQMACYN